jgi:hypothetical protein
MEENKLNNSPIKTDRKFPLWLKIGFWCFITGISPLLFYSLLLFIASNPNIFSGRVSVLATLPLILIGYIIKGPGDLGFPKIIGYPSIQIWIIPFKLFILGSLVGGFIHLGKKSKLWLILVLAIIAITIFYISSGDLYTLLYFVKKLI